MNIQEMTQKDFRDLPEREWDEDIGPFSGLVILPTRYRHDSGYGCMDFVACDGNKPLCRLSGCSDVIHIDGIGGYGIWDSTTGIPKQVSPKRWSIDMLYKSKLLRLFSEGEMTCGQALSSFELYSKVSK